MMDPCALLLEDYATKGYVAPERQPQADYGEEERAFHQLSSSSSGYARLS